jgi:hypothetical protein
VKKDLHSIKSQIFTAPTHARKNAHTYKHTRNVFVVVRAPVISNRVIVAASRTPSRTIDCRHLYGDENVTVAEDKMAAEMQESYHVYSDLQLV